jgi:hypothetical protein
MNKVKIVYRNPLEKYQTIDYTVEVFDNELANNWFTALKNLLREQKYLEKNFCFLGFPDSPRDLEYICGELRWAKNEINQFFRGEYEIEENYSTGDLLPDSINPNQELMNKLHNHFEVLQGTVWGLSDWYKRADYTTKFAIRQLNNLCHEAESLMLSQKKKIEAPQWIRPSQITTFLNSPRFEFPTNLKRTFDKSCYDRKFGHVYLHWTQIGKTLFEVFIDEQGRDIDQSVCEAITHLRYYSGEFDIEWSRDVTYAGDYPWHKTRMDQFSEWLTKNGFDHSNTEYNFGYHEVGKIINLQDPESEWSALSKHLDIFKIEAGDVSAEFNYSWADKDYYDQQILRLKPGYDYSSSLLNK